MPNQVPVQIARERNKILRHLAAEKKQVFMKSFLGKTLQAITLNAVLNRPGGEFTEALTDNYQKLFLKGRYQPNRWISAQIGEIKEGTLSGDIAPPPE
jgi:threonylcarbamoyladenosine tRNA methylthiotransferase MtaB